MQVYDAGSEKLFESINEIKSNRCHTFLWKVKIELRTEN